MCVFRNSCGEKISHFSKFPSVPQFIKSSAASRVASVAALVSPHSAGKETVKHTEHIILTHAHAKCWQLDAAVGICFRSRNVFVTHVDKHTRYMWTYGRVKGGGYRLQHAAHRVTRIPACPRRLFRWGNLCEGREGFVSCRESSEASNQQNLASKLSFTRERTSQRH